MAHPEQGDKIMMFTERWMDLILRSPSPKTLEIRSRCLQPGTYWMGMRKAIHGKIVLGCAFEIADLETWARLRSRHCVESIAMPYKRTWALPILEAKSLKKKIPVTHPQGAVSIVRYKK